jgi:hypothetical protein
MGNKITEKYFDQPNFAVHEKRVLRDISRKTQFHVEKEIFRGQIYDKNVVGSLIYRGTWEGKPAVLKIQGLHPEIDEIDIIEKFNRQNRSAKIRLPRLYLGSRWNARDGYGFLLLEYVVAPKIYQPPFANREQQRSFCAFYQEYKARCVRTSLFPPEPSETSSLVFTTQRVSHWTKVAHAKGDLTNDGIRLTETFLTLAGRHLPSIPMEFMHGHLTYDDIFQVSENEYVLMSNLFWSYRPANYDAAFHLWAGIKSIRTKPSVDRVKRYLHQWLIEYKKLPIIKRGSDFERSFSLMMAERCLGAFLIDIHNQYYARQKGATIIYLSKLFREIFMWYTKKL